MDRSLQLPDYVVIVGYFAIMIVVAAYCSRTLRQIKQYFTGGNRIPWWLAGISFYMTGFTAYVFMGYSEMAYKHGFVAVTLFGITGFPILAGAFLLAGRWRRARVTSPTEFLAQRYSPALQQIMAWSNFPVRIIDNGLRIYATGYLLSDAMGFHLYGAIALCGLISLGSAFVGGVWAAMVSDFVQFLVQTAGVLLLIPLAIHRIGGMGNIGAGAPEGFFAPWSGPDGPYSLFYVMSWLVLVAISYNSNFALVQRYYSVPDERAARNVGLLGGVLMLVSPFLFFLPALLAPQFLPALADTKNTYPSLCRELLPPGMLGIIIAAMFAATMGNLSSEYNVMASVLTQDVYRRHLNPAATPRRLIRVGMGATLVLGVLPMGISLVLASQPQQKSFFDLMKTLFDVVLAPTALPILGGLLWRRLTARGALAGFILGLLAGLAFFILGQIYVLPLKQAVLTSRWGAWTAFASTGATLIPMIAVSLLWRRRPEEDGPAAAFFERLETPIAADAPAAAGEAGADISPFFIVGLCTTGVGALLLAAGLLTPGSLARTIDLAMGAGLAALGLALWRPWRKRAA